jgi:curved DNA-binding protein CbpA
MMAPHNELEVKGNLEKYPLAELIVEIKQSRLSGSLRLEREAQKTIIYFEKGELAHAVSNARKLRLFEILLEHKKIERAQLADHPSFTNDIEFFASLQRNGDFTTEELDHFRTLQAETTVVDALGWTEGNWTFSPLSRIRKGMARPINAFSVMINYARCLPIQTVCDRFKSVEEVFELTDDRPDDTLLQAHENYVVSRFIDRALSLKELRAVNSLPDSGLLQALYVLWLGGILKRRDWNSAFNPIQVGKMLSAKVELVKEARSAEATHVQAPPRKIEEEPQEPKPVSLPVIEISLEEYLARAVEPNTHYELLGISLDSDLLAIKNAYFGLAKLFHPDRFHRESADKLRLIQVAFTNLAHAYETLKVKESREGYDAKVKKGLEAQAKRAAEGDDSPVGAADTHTEHGLESFERGLSLLNNGDIEGATAFLARAVHYSPDNALYHAYYGQALSEDPKKKFRAEAELQTAVRLSPNDAKIRIMLAEFYIDMNMAKRATGELTRFLESSPGDSNVERLLAKISA